MKTQAAFLHRINVPLKVEELDLPLLKEGQVLVKVAYSGICHSQLNEIRGLRGEDKFLPHTLGHEGSGIVEEVGPGVEKVRPGDHVVLTWIKGSGRDVPSAAYKNSNGSLVNSGAISTFLTKAVISENRLVKILQEMPLRQAALFGCAIPTGAGIVFNTVKAKKEDSIAVFGVGGLGMSAILAADSLGVNTIIAVDILEDKLILARSLGATHTICASSPGTLAAIYNLTDGRGVDYAIECAGASNAMETAFQSVRDRGGLCIVAGNVPHGGLISLNPFDLIKGKRIVGTWGGETDPDRDIPRYVNLFLSGMLKLDKIPTEDFSLRDINLACQALENGKTGRAIIDLSQTK